MSYQVSLMQDDKLNVYQKYRNGFPGAVVFSTTVVNIGNFSVKDLFVDNTVEIGAGSDATNESTYDHATRATHIRISWGGWVVVGRITSTEYINDNNVKIGYAVDPFTSANLSGAFTELKGLCERASVIPANFNTNIQAEPFSPSDQSTINEGLSLYLQRRVASVEGDMSSYDRDPLLFGRYDIVLTVSNRVVEYLNIDPMTYAPLTFAKELKDVETLEFSRPDVTRHSGGIFRGVPIKFTELDEVTTFIKEILGGCGFRTELPATGYDKQKATTHQQYIINNASGAGEAYMREKNENSDPVESITYITEADIYNCYVLPRNFTGGRDIIDRITDTIGGFKGTGNLHPWGAETQRSNKLLTYPYYYIRVLTANGDQVTVIPQSHSKATPDQLDLTTEVKFVGGDTPRLMARFEQKDFNGIIAIDTEHEWFTVISYPSITISINNSYNPQIMRETNAINQIGVTYTQANTGHGFTSPFGKGAREGIQTNWSDYRGATEGMNLGEGVMHGLGATTNFLTFGLAGKAVGNKPLREAQTVNRQMNANNFLSPAQSTIQGNDFLHQLNTPRIMVFDCGASEAEMFSFCRYLEEYGATLNCIIEPLTNAGDVWGGDGVITPFEGRTFYLFNNITVNGNMPISWREGIKNMFESGVYLI